MSEVYLELRVFRWDEGEHGVFPAPVPGEIDRVAIEFKNLTNATAIFEDAKKVLSAAVERGIPQEADRIKSGPKRR